MNASFLHTGDLQLGKPFASIPVVAKRNRVQQQERLHAATKAAFCAACAAIGSLKVPVLVIPGNHDHAGPGSIWGQEFFRREQHRLAPNLRVLLTTEPVLLENSIIFPAPLLRRHEASDPTAWIRTAVEDPALPPDLPRVVLTHGTIQGFGSSQENDEGYSNVMNWIDLSRLPVEQLDYIALGDWHGTNQVGPKAWDSGTPKIDRFPKGERNDSGNLVKVTVSRGRAPVVEKIPSSLFLWKEMTFRFSDDASLDLFASQMDDTIGQRDDEHLSLLFDDGSLGIEASGRLEEILECWESRLLRLKLDQRVIIAPTGEETRRSENEDRRTTARTHPTLDGSSDPQTDLSHPLARSEAARELNVSELRRANAIEKLHQLFSSSGEAIDRSLVYPLADSISGYFQYLFGPGAEVRVNLSNTGIEGLDLIRTGDPALGFSSLSGGAKEQVAAAVRLAMAEILTTDHDGCLHILVDDAFADTDPERVKILQRMLNLAALRRLQVIGLSCTPNDYSTFGATEVRVSPVTK